MKINKKLLPVKGHYFLFNAGTAPLVPYLTTYARQLGFSSATVGLIYTILPIFGLIAKPLFGVIADKYKSQKTIFIIFQIITIISFSAIYFIPREVPESHIEMDCGDTASAIKTCYPESGDIDQCKISEISKINNTLCKMNCNMTSQSMWQTVCERWHMPLYCYRMVKTMRYTAMINNVTNTSDCLSISTHTVKLDGLMYESRCRGAKPHIIMNELCSLDCYDPSLTALIDKNIVNMTCKDGKIDFRLCNYDEIAIDNVMEKHNLGACEVYCNISSPFVLMELCESWNAGVASSCHTRNPEALPDQLSFDTSLLLSKMVVDDSCIYIEMDYIKTVDGSIHYPYCGPKAYYELWPNEFKSACDINCENQLVNELLEGATGEKKAGSEYSELFWMFFFMMIISWIGQAVVVTFADAICFNTLGPRISQYGRQRLWGSVGWGIFSLLTGTLIDIMSEGAYKNYSIAFILMFIFMLGDVFVSCFIKVDMTKISINIVADVRTLLSSPPTVVFLFWTIAVGLCTGLMWQFLFWHIEDIAGQACDGANYVKTLQGLVSAIQTFGGEIPFMFVSGHLLKKFGHNMMMSLVLFAFGIRLILYSYLTSAWWILPIELFQGLTSGMFYPTMTSYANVVAPPGTETTVQGLVGAVFEGVGSSLGSFIGGRLYGIYGGWITFRCFGYGALVACAIHAIAMIIFKNKPHLALTQELSTVVHFRRESTDTAVHVLVDEIEGTSQSLN